MTVNNILSSPHRLFAILALVFGMVFVFITPPFAGSDENYQYERVAALVYGNLLEKEVSLPAGVVEFAKNGYEVLTHDVPNNHVYSEADYRALGAISLQRDHQVMMEACRFVNYSPVAYFPQIVAFYVADAFNLPPMVWLYLGRIAGLFAATGILWVALRLAPSHQFVFAALALLPGMVFFRSIISADNITIALAFLLIICILRAAVETKPMVVREVVLLALTSFLLAQCKSAYMLLPCLAVCIPTRRFASLYKKIAVLAVIIIPGLIAGGVWLVWTRNVYFAGEHYLTHAGMAYPDGQASFILHQPLEFLGVFLHTLTSTYFLTQQLGVVGVLGWTNVALPGWSYIVVLLALILVVMQDYTSRDVAYSRWLLWTAAGLFFFHVFETLVLLYMQWTGFKDPIIQGFQGRYYYPFLPLLLVLSKPVDGVQKNRWAGVGIVALAFTGLPAALWALYTHFLAS